MPVRAALFTSVLLALWTLAPFASAMPAGLCDDRGASAIAPPPAFEAPDVAIRRARAPYSCADHRLPAYARIAPGHRGVVSSPVTHYAALPIATVPLAHPVAERVVFCEQAKRPLSGIRWRVERPPRG